MYHLRTDAGILIAELSDAEAFNVTMGSKGNVVTKQHKSGPQTGFEFTAPFSYGNSKMQIFIFEGWFLYKKEG